MTPTTSGSRHMNAAERQGASHDHAERARAGTAVLIQMTGLLALAVVFRSFMALLLRGAGRYDLSAVPAAQRRVAHRAQGPVGIPM
jgi:hypothetical protein